VLVGERVRLRPLHASDAERAFEVIHRRREILRWLHWPGPESVDDLLLAFAHWAAYGEDGDNYQFTIADRDDDRFAGSISVRFAGHPGVGEIGYWLGIERWGRGWMSEAVGLLAHLGFAHLDAHRLDAIVFTGNDASRRVLEKNGFEDVTGESDAPRLDAERDQWTLALERETWSARESRVRPTHEEVTLVDERSKVR
jgi:RimJ/RimL family protein N-acetyltransferase